MERIGLKAHYRDSFMGEVDERLYGSRKFFVIKKTGTSKGSSFNYPRFKC